MGGTRVGPAPAPPPPSSPLLGPPPTASASPCWGRHRGVKLPPGCACTLETLISPVGQHPGSHVTLCDGSSRGAEGGGTAEAPGPVLHTPTTRLAGSMALGRTARAPGLGVRSSPGLPDARAERPPLADAEDRVGAEAREEGRGSVYQRSRPRPAGPACLPRSTVIYFPV